MNVRLKQLCSLAKKDPTDPFLKYAIALEYMSLNKLEDAVGVLENLMETSPDYTPGFHQAGRIYEKLDRFQQARQCFEQGLIVAEKEGNTKDLEEMREALASL